MVMLCEFFCKKIRLPVAFERDSDTIPSEHGTLGPGTKGRSTMKSRLSFAAAIVLFGSHVLAQEPRIDQPTVLHAAPAGTAVYGPAPVTLPTTVTLPSPPVPLTRIDYAPIVVYRPILPLAPVPSHYYLGRGILGQPKLYVPGQPIQNLLRYLSP
jgi:hypothetical protein